MYYIIDKTYFNGILNVPNIYEVNSEELNNLNMNINKYARLFMQEFLVTQLFIDFESHLTGGVLNNTAPQKWLNLVNGVTYTLNDKTYVWRGLKYTLGTTNVSLLANFVYYFAYQNSINTSVGQILVNPRNANNVNASEHLAEVYNDFVDKYQGYSSPNAKQYYHNGVLFIDYHNGSNSGFVSLLQFVTDKKADYLGINAPCLNYQNRFGI